ncbi:MAG: sulfotransferase [Anaerolineales bacterium]|nr:sulfotransferase [Anaerolineales bacterium]
MKFNLRLFLRQIGYSLARSEGTPARLTPRRVIILLFFFPIFTLLELSSWLGFAWDDIFYREYKQQKLAQPVFIIGNPRSGTTFLHRLMANDKTNFSIIRMWEVLFAPSISQRKVFWFFQKIDDALGGKLQRWLLEQEKMTWLSNPIHKMGLLEPEEDESILFNIWETIFTSVFFPHPDLVRNYAYFDKQLPPPRRRKIMRFYRDCLRRHLFARNSDKKFLSKNPTFCPKIDSLYEFFPDTRIIYLVRNPLDTIPSIISWMSYEWKQFSDPAENYLFKDYMLELAKEWYEYPLERFAEAPADSYAIIRYEDLVRNPKQIVTGIYEKFAFELSPEFEKILNEANRRESSFKSRHKYSLRKMGLSKREILKRFGFVFKRFGYT